MRPTQAVKCINEAINNKHSYMLWGPSGIGKSQIVQQIAKSKGIGMIDMRLSTYDPTDLKGLLYFKDDKAVWLSLGELPDVMRDGEEGILFLDEINAAPPATAAAAYRLVLDREIGNYKMPDGWSIVAAGNRESDKGVTYKMPAPLANRFIHGEVETSFDDWIDWALHAGIDDKTISFIRFRPGLLHDFDPAQRAFPTPRSWERASKYNKVADHQTRQELFNGCVGPGPGVEYSAFIKMADDLTDPDMIIMNPEESRVPADLNALYATVGALAARATPANFEAITTYAKRIKKEFQVLLIRDSAIRNRDITRTPEFAKWALANSSILI